MKFFRSRKPTQPKGNTVKKKEHLDNRQTREETTDGNNDRGIAVVNASNVGAWIEEGKVESQNGDKGEEQAVLRSLTGPRRATLVDGVSNKSAQIEPEPQATPPTAETTGAHKVYPPPQQKVKLLLGTRNTSSQYFTQRIVQASTSRDPVLAAYLSRLSSPMTIEGRGDQHTRLDDIDPHAFELYQIWLHTGFIPSQEPMPRRPTLPAEATHIWQACWPLINAHILGHTIGTPEFSDRVIDMLQEKVEIGVCADVDTIKHLFSTSSEKIPESLKRFVVDRCVDAGVEGVAGVHISELPPAFVHLMLETALHRLATGNPVPRQMECAYHTHATPEACYKRHIPSADQRRAQRCADERAKSNKDSEEVEKSVKLNGVWTVDWEQRRTEANRVLREQTGKTWVGFSRPSNHRSGTTETNNSLSGGLFGTTQTSGDVDDVLAKAPNRSAPQIPHTAEHPTFAACSSQNSDTLPDYEATAEELTLNASPDSSPSSTFSNTDPELRRSLEMALEHERRWQCPGAFPISRKGSPFNLMF